MNKDDTFFSEGMDNRLILKVTGISDVVLSDVKAKKIDKE